MSRISTTLSPMVQLVLPLACSVALPIQSEKDSFSAPDSLAYTSAELLSVMACPHSCATTSSAAAKETMPLFAQKFTLEPSQNALLGQLFGSLISTRLTI